MSKPQIIRPVSDRVAIPDLGTDALALAEAGVVLDANICRLLGGLRRDELADKEDAIGFDLSHLPGSRGLRHAQTASWMGCGTSGFHPSRNAAHALELIGWLAGLGISVTLSGAATAETMRVTLTGPAGEKAAEGRAGELPLLLSRAVGSYLAAAPIVVERALRPAWTSGDTVALQQWLRALVAGGPRHARFSVFYAEAKAACVCDRDDLRGKLFFRVAESCGSHTKQTWDLIRAAASAAINGVGIAYDWHGERGSEGISIVLDTRAPWLAQQGV